MQVCKNYLRTQKTEMWSLDKNSSTIIGDELIDYGCWSGSGSYPALLFNVDNLECRPCDTECLNGICIYIDRNKHCRCFEGYNNRDNDPLKPCDSGILSGYAPEYSFEVNPYCFISATDKVAVFETKNLYDSNSECSAEFECNDNQLPRYLIERFLIEQGPSCSYDHIGLYTQLQELSYLSILFIH